MTLKNLIFIGSIVLAYTCSITRKIMLKKIGKKILGEKYYRYAILELKDVSYDKLMGFLAEVIASLILDPLWSMINWLAALRAYKALYSNDRSLSFNIVFNTLMLKNAPMKVWKEFFRNDESKKYLEEFKKFKSIRLQNIE